MKVAFIAVLVLLALGLVVIMLPKPMRAPETPIAWPVLPTEGFLTGRVATQDDVNAGLAVFATEGADSVRAPLSITVPQYAYHRDQESRQLIPVIIVQAERAGPLEMIGYRTLTGGDGVALRAEFDFLGASTPRTP